MRAGQSSPSSAALEGSSKSLAQASRRAWTAPSGAQIQVVTRCGGGCPNIMEENLGKEAPEELANADWAHARTFVQGDESACHHAPISRPRGGVVGKPRGPLSDFFP
jgi:hypothetical protein